MNRLTATALSFACLSGIASAQVVMFENQNNEFAWYMSSEYTGIPGNDLDITQGPGQTITYQGNPDRSVHWNYRNRWASLDYEYFGFSSRVARGQSYDWHSYYTNSGRLIFAGLAPLGWGDTVGPDNDFGPPPNAEFDYIVWDIISAGQWLNFGHIHYLGVRIWIDGKHHYGWIHINPTTDVVRSPFYPFDYTRVMYPVRWAYEQQPNTPIRIGLPCRPDLNSDGVLDADDFFLFLQFFADGDARADFNSDGVIDADDFWDFLSAFAAGCP